MSTSPSSAKRRHILSSINPDLQGQRHDRQPSEPRRRDYRSRSPEKVSSADTPEFEPPEDNAPHGAEDTMRPRRSRLKLKKDKPRRERDREESPDRSERRRHRHHHHRHRRRRRSPTPPNPHEPAPLDPDAAFRESLFDAMADDEGAAYWEGVYGQPVHVYTNEKVGPTGELEQMTEEEYASYVRQKMWEKTHAGLLEERARREEARKKKEKEERHSRKLQAEMEESLRRGDERRREKMWIGRWEEYIKAWSTWDGSLNTLPWPVESGRRQDIAEKDVRTFFVHGLGLRSLGEQAFVSKLREERVRWHPDKIQQKLGGQVDDAVMRDVTAIFQIIDGLWADARDNKT